MSRKYIPTHTGVLIGDSREANRSVRVSFKETKMYFITKNGFKYHRSTGSGTGRWPRFYLDLTSIKTYEREDDER